MPEKKTGTKNYSPRDFSSMGKVGGRAKVPKGFAKNRKLASESGKVGGTISRRGKKVKVQQEDSTEENITLT